MKGHAVTIDEVIQSLTDRHDRLIERRNHAETSVRACDFWGEMQRQLDVLLGLDAQVMLMTDIIWEIRNKLDNERRRREDLPVRSI